jgi:hypothetical protein
METKCQESISKPFKRLGKRQQERDGDQRIDDGKADQPRVDLFSGMMR